MSAVLAFCVIASIIIIHSSPVVSYHPDFTWENVDTMMNPDLRGRMKKGGMKERRKYCGDCSQDTDNDSYRICGNNGIMYPNQCIFTCSKTLMPALQEAEDYAICGPISFTEFKLEEFKSHY